MPNSIFKHAKSNIERVTVTYFEFLRLLKGAFGKEEALLMRVLVNAGGLFQAPLHSPGKGLAL